MREPQAGPRCRSCGNDRGDLLVDLGAQPDPDRLLDPRGLDDAPVAAVRAWICSSCGLVQLAGPRPDGPRMPHGHPSAEVSSTLIADARIQRMIRLLPADHRLVVEIDATEAGIGETIALGGSSVAGFAPQPGGSWYLWPRLRMNPLGADTTKSHQLSGQRAGLIVAGHAMTHTDDLDGLMGAIESVLAPGGLVSIEFHHVLGLAHGQFDVLSHVHRSYLSLHSLERLLERYGLIVVTAERVPEYGGTVRVLAGRRSLGDGPGGGSAAVERIKQTEREAQLQVATGYRAMPGQVARARTELHGFLEHARQNGRMVAGYGAAARGTVLLNVAGIGPEHLPFIVDRSPDKQGRLLPGCRIPVHAPGEIERVRPDDIMILPWPLAPEILQQLAGARTWGARFFVAMPHLETLE